MMQVDDLPVPTLERGQTEAPDVPPTSPVLPANEGTARRKWATCSTLLDASAPEYDDIRVGLARNVFYYIGLKNKAYSYTMNTIVSILAWNNLIKNKIKE